MKWLHSDQLEVVHWKVLITHQKAVGNYWELLFYILIKMEKKNHRILELLGIGII